MKKSHLLFSTLALSLLSMTAFAENATVIAPHENSKNHLYVEANVGYARVATPGKTSTGTTTEAERGNATAGINAGYAYDINKTVRLGGEVGYSHDGYSQVKLGAGPTELAKITSQDIRLLLTSDYRLTSSPMDIFAKAGVARVCQSMDNTNMLGHIASKTEYTPITTFGLGYMLNPQVNLHLQYTHIFGNTQSQLPAANGSFAHVDSIDSFTLGSSYFFPMS